MMDKRTGRPRHDQNSLKNEYVTFIHVLFPLFSINYLLVNSVLLHTEHLLRKLYKYFYSLFQI